MADRPLIGMSGRRALSRPMAAPAPAVGEPAADKVGPPPQVYILTERGRGAGGRVTISGQAEDTPAAFVVLDGSYGPATDGVMSPGYAGMRAQLRADGVLVDACSGLARFSRDYVFRSPSAAATMVAGSNQTGPKAWRDEHGQSLAQIRSAASGAQS